MNDNPMTTAAPPLPPPELPSPLGNGQSRRRPPGGTSIVFPGLISEKVRLADQKAKARLTDPLQSFDEKLVGRSLPDWPTGFVLMVAHQSPINSRIDSRPPE